MTDNPDPSDPHGHRPERAVRPGSGGGGTAGARVAKRVEPRSRARGAYRHEQCASHVSASTLPAPIEAASKRVLERGAPGILLPDFAVGAGVDLLVLGSQGRSGLAQALPGSTAENLLHTLDGDALVVRGE